MKIGISSWSCPWAIGVVGYPQPDRPMRAMDLLQRALDVSAEVLQIADNLPLHNLPTIEIRELARATNDSKIKIEIGTKGLNSDNLLRYLDLAKTFGAKLVRTLPHDGTDRPDFHEALKRLQVIKGEYEAAGITLAIENHDFYPSSWIKELIETVASPNIGVCLDAVNNLGLGESFKEVIGNLGSHTVNFHCKDYQIARKPTMLGFDVVGCPAGTGMLDLDLARKVLCNDISWIIESWMPWQGDIASTIQMEKEWILSGIENLKAYQ